MYPSYFARHVPATPASAPRTPKPSATLSARAFGPGLSAAECGCATSFTIESLDSYGERRRGGGDIVVARLVISDEVKVQAYGIDNTDGTYTCTYVAESVDRRQKLHVTVNGIPVAGSPFRPELTAGPVCAQMSTATGTCLYDSIAGKRTTFTVQARDCFGNPRRVGGDRFNMVVHGVAPNSAEYKESFRIFKLLVDDVADNGDGTYSISWQADLPGSYDLDVTCDRTPLKGSPFRCYLASSFVRPPLALGATLVQATEKSARAPGGKGLAKPRQTAPPLPAERPACVMVDGQLLVLSTALSMPGAAGRWPSVHACQFEPQYMHEDAYLAAKPPPCRWRSCLLPSHKLDAKHTLVGGDAALYVISQNGGATSPVDAIACTEVVGGGAWCPPQFLVPLRCAGPSPEAVEGFCAAYTPPIAAMRRPAPPPPEPEPVYEADPDDEDYVPPPPPPKGKPKKAAEAEEAAQGEAAPATMALGPCLWMLGGSSMGPASVACLLDIYSVEDERWLGNPFAHEEEALQPPAVTNGASCVVRPLAGQPADSPISLYLFGGRHHDGTLSDELWRLDPAALAWSLVKGDGDPCPARESCSLTHVLSRYLFVHGGLSVEGRSSRDSRT